MTPSASALAISEGHLLSEVLDSPELAAMSMVDLSSPSPAPKPACVRSSAGMVDVDESLAAASDFAPKDASSEVDVDESLAAASDFAPEDATSEVDSESLSPLLGDESPAHKRFKLDHLHRHSIPTALALLSCIYIFCCCVFFLCVVCCCEQWPELQEDKVSLVRGTWGYRVRVYEPKIFLHVFMGVEKVSFLVYVFICSHSRGWENHFRVCNFWGPSQMITHFLKKFLETITRPLLHLQRFVCRCRSLLRLQRTLPWLQQCFVSLRWVLQWCRMHFYLRRMPLKDPNSQQSLLREQKFWDVLWNRRFVNANTGSVGPTIGAWFPGFKKVVAIQED